MRNIAFYSSLTLLALVPLYFVWNRVYKDGVMGRAALLTISFCSWAILLDVTLGEDEDKYTPSRLGVMLVVAFTAFLCWHLWRFHRRVEKRLGTQCPPDCPQDRRKVPDRRFA